MERENTARAGRVREILDALAAEIASGGAVAYMRDRVRHFDDGIMIPMNGWSLCNRMIAFFHGTRDARTFAAWREAGRHPRKGSHAFQIVAPLFRTERDEATDEEKRVLSGFRLINEFRAEDTEGRELPYHARMRELNVGELPLIDVAERLGITVRADLCGGADGSFSPSERTIRMNCADGQVFLHELSHGVIAEIKRKEGVTLEYGFEEICAELSSAFLGSLFGVETDLQNTRAYIHGWAGKGHVAWKMVEAVEWAERVWRFIDGIRSESHTEEKRMGKNASGTAAKPAAVLPFRTEDFRDRSQVYNPKIGKWVKRDARTGLFTSVKVDGRPFSRVRIEDSPFGEAARRLPDGMDFPPAA